MATSITYGPVASNGTVNVRVTYDPRVRDAVTIATVLSDLEDVLSGAIVRERLSEALEVLERKGRRCVATPIRICTTEPDYRLHRQPPRLG